MSTSKSHPMRLRYDGRDELHQRIEHDLKRIYSRGIYVDEHYQSSSGSIIIHLGNLVPKDVSDCRDRDNVLKFISIDPIFDLEAEPTERGYLVELPERDELYDGFIAQRDKILTRLDVSLARNIYKNLVQLPAIENQLTPIRQILQYTRQYSPEITVDDMREIQNSSNTDAYVSVLQEIDFIGVDENGVLYPEEKLNTYDLDEISMSEFGQLVLGDVVQEAYHTMRDELQLTMLGHYPKFSTAYYFAAIQKEDPDLWLDAASVRRNLSHWYDEDHHPIVVQEKLNQLASVDVLKKEEDLFSANDAIYHGARKRVTG